jgi:hypothetical protein
MIIAIVITFLKTLTKACLKTVDDGIPLVYLTDILIKYFSDFTAYIDLAYIAINIASLATSNDS